ADQPTATVEEAQALDHAILALLQRLGVGQTIGRQGRAHDVEDRVQGRVGELVASTVALDRNLSVLHRVRHPALGLCQSGVEQALLVDVLVHVHPSSEMRRYPRLSRTTLIPCPAAARTSAGISFLMALSALSNCAE
ncbi:MAG: hypothetical protein ACK56I_00930, partial [bacterium]